MVLLIDNYDSFVYNLSHYFQELGEEVVVLRNDRTTSREVEEMGPSAVVLSPGPCGPEQAGISLSVVRDLGDHVPILGICLGHQCIAQAYGGRIIRAPEPMHGRTSQIFHERGGVFEGIENPLTATRYHSLVADPSAVPECLEITARTEDGIIMGLQHREHPVVGLQFHPESVLTQRGHELLSNFLEMTGARSP